jgi:hypothetical protein
MRKQEIRFGALLSKVLYFRNLKKPYILQLNGESYAFHDTVEIVPFVRKLGWKVTEGRVKA